MDVFKKLERITEKLGPRLKSLSTTKPGTRYPGAHPETFIPQQGHEKYDEKPQREKSGKFGTKLTAMERDKLERHRIRSGSRDDEVSSGYVELSQPHQQAQWARQQARTARHKARQGIKKIKGAKPGATTKKQIKQLATDLKAKHSN